MQVYINDIQVETQLNNEQNLAEVYEEVKKWAESQGKYLLKCFKDGEEYSLNELSQMEIQPSVRLDFYIGERIDVLVSTLLELDNYIDKVGTTLVGRDSLTEVEQRDLKEGLNWMQDVLLSASQFLNLDYTKIFPIPEGNSVAQIFANLLENSKKLTSSSQIESFLENLRDLKLFTMNLISKTTALTVDISTLRDVIRAYSQNMEVIKNEFVRVNENLQSGKEVLAGEILNYSTERLQVLLNAIMALQTKTPNQIFANMKISGKTLSQTVEKLKNLLNQVASSFESNDLIMAGDILEYELPDVLEELVPFLSELHKIE